MTMTLYYYYNYYYYRLSYILFSLTVVAVYGRVGESYTGSTAIDNDRDNNVESSPPTCGIVYSTSLIDPNRYALYVTKEYNHTEILLSDQELVVPIINANKNEYSPWHDFAWKDDLIPSRMRDLKYHNDNHLNNHSIFTREYFIAGIAAIAPCTSNYNVKPNYDQLLYGSLSENQDNHMPAMVDPESVSDYHNFIIQTTEPLQPAGRMIVNECGHDTNVPEQAATTLVHPHVDAWRRHRDTNDGICMDTLHVRPSTRPGIGRGAFSKYSVSRGHVVATSPVLHLDRSQMNIVPQSIMFHDVDHTIPLYRTHNIEYRASQTRVGQQLLLNYCFGHASSNVLLLPYGPGVNFINHQSPDQANVMIRWSEHKLAASSTTFRTSTPILEMFEQPAGTSTTNLMMEYVAIQDILPGDEIFLDYREEFGNAWDEHAIQLASSSSSQPHEPFRHEIGVPDGFYPDRWMRADPNPTGDFIASPLVPGHMAPVRWKGTAEIVTPWAFRIGLPSRVRKVLLQYCNEMGITDILRHVTVDGNGLEPGTETHMELEGDDWYLQRPDANWRSNLHWFSPGAAPAHEHYLQALSAAGFDKVLQGVGEYLGMEGLVAFHVTFIAGSYSNRGFLHNDVSGTNAKVYNIIIPLLLANETGPELDLQSWNPGRPEEEQDFRVGRYRYEYDVGSMLGDNAVHATSACDYRYRNEMRMAATVYVADVNDINAANVLKHYTQAYPPRELDLLKSWSGRHWKRNDPSRTLPKPALDHILVHSDNKHSDNIWKASPSRGRVLLPPQSSPNVLDDEPVDEL